MGVAVAEESHRNIPTMRAQMLQHGQDPYIRPDSVQPKPVVGHNEQAFVQVGVCAVGKQMLKPYAGLAFLTRETRHVVRSRSLVSAGKKLRSGAHTLGALWLVLSAAID